MSTKAELEAPRVEVTTAATRLQDLAEDLIVVRDGLRRETALREGPVSGWTQKHSQPSRLGPTEWGRYRRRLGLRQPDLAGADLRNEVEIDADLHKADLRKANLPGANLSVVELADGDLRWSALTEANRLQYSRGP